MPGPSQAPRRQVLLPRTIASAAAVALAASIVVIAAAPASAAADVDGVDRGYELVTSGPKTNGRGVGWNFAGDSAALPGAVSSDGDRVISATATNVLGDPAFAFAFDYNLHERTQAGWTSRTAFTRRNYGAGAIGTTLEPQAVSRDLSTQAWMGTGKAFLYPEMAGWPVSTAVNYLRDWGNAWTVMSPTDPAQQIRADLGKTVISGDGSQVVLSSYTRKLLGVDDPSQDQLAAANGGQTLYQTDASGGVSDGLLGAQPKTTNVGVCTGEGPGRTRLPSRTDDATPRLTTRPCPDGLGGRPGLISTAGASIGFFNAGTAGPMTNALSQDGSRLFFHSPDPAANRVASACAGTEATTSCPPQLYVRQSRTGQQPTTRWISRSRVPDQAASLLGKAAFGGASADGSTVFFRTTSPLTADDPNGQPVDPTDPRPITNGTPSTNSWDLYKYDLPTDPAADPSDGTLTRITRGPTGSSDPQAGNGAGDLEPVRFVSDDGSRVYFVTAKPLEGVAAPTNGTSTAPGQSGTPAFPTAMNLYLFDANKSGAARWEFIAQLPHGSTALSTCATSAPTPVPPLAPSNQGTFMSGEASCVRGSADGRLITFMTAGQLVPGDDDAAVDLYAFDQAKDSLQRVSAAQGVGGASTSYPCVTGGADAGAPCNADLGFRSAVPKAPLSNVINDDGTGGASVVFQSKRRLLPDAPDGIYSVYVWRGGKLSLITPGNEDGAAYYSGNSANGRDIFVETRQRLAWDDVDDQMDIYDKRIGGGFPAPPDPPPPCQGEACQGPAPPLPVPPVPQSLLFAGPGNVAPPVAKAPVKLKVAKPKMARGTQATLRVTVSEKGRLTAAGSGLQRAAKSVPKAGTYTVRLKLSKRATRTLKRKGQVRATVRVAFAASRAKASTVRVRLRFASAKRTRQAKASGARLSARTTSKAAR